MLTVNVLGTPAPQGSKKAFAHRTTGRVVVVEQNNTKVRSWRRAVAETAREAHGTREPMSGPVEVTVVFYMPRPVAHFRTGQHAGELKPGAPVFCDKRPDLDKTLRSTNDALKEAGIYRDDAQIVLITAAMEYANGPTGARITVAPLTAVARPVVEAGDGTEQKALL